MPVTYSSSDYSKLFQKLTWSKQNTGSKGTCGSVGKIWREYLSGIDRHGRVENIIKGEACREFDPETANRLIR